ncbi:hypothetical protein LLH03_17185 [bacterium]|nr:hypothetical protein [bacterium]
MYRTTMASLLAVVLCVAAGAQREATITVYPDKALGQVNWMILGNNQLAYQGSERYSNRGAGLWDPVKRQPVPEYVALSKQAGISVQRWPGGCTTHNYNWKVTVGPLAERPNMQFGLPEFMTFCEATDSIPLISVAVFWGTAQDGADLVEYLNAPNDGSNPKGGKDWAAVRAGDGHPKPYGVVYFEYGNEDYHGEHKTAQNPNPRKITAEDYARQYLQYQAAMKAVDPQIQLGGLLQNGMADWNQKVLEGCGKTMDFGIEHTYTPGHQGDTDESKTRGYMEACVAVDQRIQSIYDGLLAQIKEVTGRTDLRLAISEYNGWFVQEKPVPYRQTLGNALRNAEHLRIMMRPENNILMANFWQFSNEYWGMVNGYIDQGQTPVKQANFFPYQLYHEHFGDTLIASEVDCAKWDFGGGLLPARRGEPSEFKLWEENLLPKDYTWEPRTPEAGAVQQVQGDTVQVTFEGKDTNYYSARFAFPAEPGMGYRVTGLVKAENLVGGSGAGFQVADDRGWNVTHSCSTGGDIQGTTDWTPVVVEYTTLPDATGVEILARRLGGKGDITGKAWYKLQSVQKFRPQNPGAVPDLGVNSARRADGTVTLMVVNKNLDAMVPVTVNVMDGITGAARAWILTGPAPEATNMQKPDTVGVHDLAVRRAGSAYQFDMPPCSMAAVEIAPR